MNQTKKRLSIINLAISITDIETIQLQILKLGLLKTDTKIQEIITVLQSENYAKAQRLIKVYIDTPMDEILQRSSQQKSIDVGELTSTNRKETIISKEDQKIIDEFQLFTTNDDNNSRQVKKQEININDYLTDVPNKPDTKEDTQASDFNDLLNLEAADVLAGNIELDISQDPNESFFDIHEKEKRSTPNTENVPRDTFFDIHESDKTPLEETPNKKETKQKPKSKIFDIPAKEEKSTPNTENVPEDTFFGIEETKETSTKETLSNDPFEALLTVGKSTKASLNNDALTKKAAIEKTFREKASLKTPLVKEETKQKPSNVISDNPEKEQLPKKPKVKVVPESYPAISYIRQKFVSMRKQYEPIQKGHDRFPTVETFLTTISKEGYKEEEIEETFQYIEKLITEQKFSEAAQLLLVCASTESQFAQLMLARELYRGVLLRKKVSEAFTILTHMADDKYPEALCDLGQFYENAISTGRDKKRAEELYKQAMDFGITRAEKHYARLKKQNKGFFRK